MKKSIFIAFLVLCTVLLSATKSITLLGNTYSNFDFVKNLTNRCQSVPRATSSSKARAILRIDDVQAFYLDDIAKKMIKDAIDKHAPVTLGVIPYKLEADVSLVNFLKNNRCNIELAVHGWDHSASPPEFAEITEQVATEKLQKGINMLEKISGKKIVTFIPPENQYSNGTFVAAEKLGIKAISSEGNATYDYDASTYDFVSDKLFTSDEVLQKCNSAFSRSQKCIIMLHPQDYVTDGVLDLNKYKQYLDLLDKLNSEGAKFTTIDDEIHTTSTVNSGIIVDSTK